VAFVVDFFGLPPFFPFRLAASAFAVDFAAPMSEAALIGFLQWGQFIFF